MASIFSHLACRRMCLSLLLLLMLVAGCASSGDTVGWDQEGVYPLHREQWLREEALPPDTAVALAARDFRELYNWNRRPPEPLRRVKEALCYEGRLATEAIEGSLHVFAYCTVEPTPHTIIFERGDSLASLYDFARFEGSALHPDLLDRLTSSMHVNAVGEQQALDLALFVVTVQDVLSNGTLRVLEDWRGISHSRVEPVPDSIRNAIEPPRVCREGGTVLVEFYVWKTTSTDLTRLTLGVEDGAVEGQLHELGRYGVRSVLL